MGRLLTEVCFTPHRQVSPPTKSRTAAPSPIQISVPLAELCGATFGTVPDAMAEAALIDDECSESVSRRKRFRSERISAALW